MQVVQRRCAGLDVHKETVVACVRTMKKRNVREEVRTFSTMTSSLYELANWLRAEKVELVGMEATARVLEVGLKILGIRTLERM